MAYTPSAYTDLDDVKRILRSCKDKLTIGDEPNDHISNADANGFILDASRYIDGLLMQYVKSSEIPLQEDYPEITFAAPRIASFLIYRSLNYNRDELPAAVKGWIDESKSQIKLFIDNINAGIYSELSPATDGPKWETAAQMFQNKIGVSCVNDQVENRSNQLPLTGDNIGPYSDS